MMRNGIEGVLAHPCRCRCTLGGRVVWVEELDCSIASASDQALVSCPAHPFDDVLMRLCLEYFLPSSKVPHLDNAISASGGEMLEPEKLLVYECNAEIKVYIRFWILAKE